MSNALFISTDELAARLGDANLAVIDGSWHMPAANRDPRAEYLAAHIPGAVFFHIDEIADRASPLPHMLPTPDEFAAAMGALGVDETKTIVVYDSVGLFSAPRVWWMLRAFGVADVAVLSGGLPKWQAEGRAVEDGETRRSPRHFTARLDHGAVADLSDIKHALDAGSAQVVDARSAARFRGEEPDPRPGLRSGHIPGSRNLPWTDIVENGVLKSADAIRAAFAASGVDINKPIMTTCGSGVSAAILTIALNSIGVRPTGLYDGSWAEWGARPDLPTAMGDA